MKKPPEPPAKPRCSKAMRVNSFAAMVSSAQWTPSTRKRKSAPADGGTESGRERDRRKQAEPRTDAEIDPKQRRRIGAQPDVQRMAERQLARKAPHHIPGLAHIGAIER